VRPGRPHRTNSENAALLEQDATHLARSLLVSNSRRVPECACGRLPIGSGLAQGLRSWTASGASF